MTLRDIYFKIEGTTFSGEAVCETKEFDIGTNEESNRNYEYVKDIKSIRIKRLNNRDVDIDLDKKWIDRNKDWIMADLNYEG